MIIGLYPNPTRDIDFAVTKKVAEFCKLKNIECYVDSEISADIGLPTCNISEKADMIITLGGDGTLLQYITNATDKEKPVLGVNLGNLGFLTEAEPKKINDAFTKLVTGDYTIEKRSMLKVIHNGKTYHSLNEAVITIGKEYKTVSLKLYIDDAHTDTLNADGIVISTPTGSTAYSLSCGGPIVSPDLAAIIISPICAHSYHSRPIVINDSHSVTITCSPENNATRLVIDGKQVGEVTPGSSVTILKSEHKVKLIKLDVLSFYSRIKLKFKAN